MMVVTFPKNYNIDLSVTGEVDVVADTPSQKIYHCSILNEHFNHLLHEDFEWLIIEVAPYGSLYSEVRPLLDGHVDAFKHDCGT